MIRSLLRHSGSMHALVPRVPPVLGLPSTVAVQDDVRRPQLGFHRLCLPVRQVLRSVPGTDKCTDLAQCEDPVASELYATGYRQQTLVEKLRTTGVSKSTFKRQSHRLSGFSWLSSRIQRTWVYECFSLVQRSNLLTVIDDVDYDQYDETPMPTAVPKQLPAGDAPQPGRLRTDLVLFNKGVTKPSSGSKEVTKLFGRESMYGLHSISATDGKRLIITGVTSNVWQGMRDMKAKSV